MIADNIGTRIGKNIRKARRKCDVKQYELAEAVGVTQATMSRYEGGRAPGADVVMLICEFLGCDVKEIMG